MDRHGTRNVRTHSLRTLIPIAVLLALAGCASKTASRMGDAAMSPLGDLNIVRAKIPEVLQEAQRHPYQLPPGRNCTAIFEEIAKLDAVLGADLDAPAPENSPTMTDRGSEVVADQAVNAVQRTAEGLVPFRSWVRKLTGAERHAKQVAAANNAGSVRRAFLKGVALSRHCPVQAPAHKQVLAGSR